MIFGIQDRSAELCMGNAGLIGLVSISYLKKRCLSHQVSDPPRRIGYLVGFGFLKQNSKVI